jgi:rubrerythrin
MNIREILEMSFDVETLAEKIYLDLSELFPEARPLFEKLSCEESRHADIVAINLKFLAIDLLPPAFAIDMIPLIRQTLAIARTLEEKTAKKEITLAEALELSLALEESGVEAYFQKVMRGESTDDALNYIKQFYKDSEFHAELIREFKEVLELNKTRGRSITGKELKLNCWEFKQCGRQPGGSHEHDDGICPAAMEERLHGVHGGVNAGRTCWVVAGTSCKGESRGTFAQTFGNCRTCDFYRKVREEERPVFQSSAALLSRLEKDQ